MISSKSDQKPGINLSTCQHTLIFFTQYIYFFMRLLPQSCCFFSCRTVTNATNVCTYLLTTCVTREETCITENSTLGRLFVKRLHMANDYHPYQNSSWSGVKDQIRLSGHLSVSVCQGCVEISQLLADVGEKKSTSTFYFQKSKNMLHKFIYY